MTRFEEREPVDVTSNSHFQAQDELPPVDLLTPLALRGVELRNRIAVSPMCQYCATDGFADEWHLVHLGSRAMGGAGLVMAEATAVTPEGRISPSDLGLWKDEHIEPLARIVRFIEDQNSVPAIQLAHAGRKASTAAPWLGGQPVPHDQGGWQDIGPSPVPFYDRPAPRELTLEGIEAVQVAFERAIDRAVQAGFRVIEIHSAHGYLLHSFLSPLSNHRQDQYGGSLENRMRMLLEVVARARRVMPEELALLVRISATDWVEGGWDITQSVELAKHLREAGVDLVDCSSGGLVPVAKIPVGKRYQVPFASQIKHEAKICTGAVGMITEPDDANEIVKQHDADLIFVGRQMLREPYWAHRAYCELDSEPEWPTQYGYAVRKRVHAKG